MYTDDGSIGIPPIAFFLDTMPFFSSTSMPF